MVISRAKMTEISPTSQYALGSTDAEHERLIRQAVRLAPLTERFFRDAGIGPGQRVLDLGSGVGDVAMLASRPLGCSALPVSVSSVRRSSGLPGELFCPVSCPFSALTALVGKRFLDFRDAPTLGSKHGDGPRSLPDVPGGGAAPASHAYGDAARE